MPQDTVGTTDRCPGCSQFKHDFCVCTRCAEKTGPDPAEAPQAPQTEDLIVIEAMEKADRGAAYVQPTPDGLYAMNLGFVKMLHSGIGLAMRMRDPEQDGRVRPDPHAVFLIAYNGRAHAAGQTQSRATVTSDVAGAYKLTRSAWASGVRTLLAELDNPRLGVVKALASPEHAHDLSGPVQRATRPIYCGAQNAEGDSVCLGHPASVPKKKCAVPMCTKGFHHVCVNLSVNVVEIAGSLFCSPSHLPPAPKPRAVPVPLAPRTHQPRPTSSACAARPSMPDEGRLQYLEKQLDLLRRTPLAPPLAPPPQVPAAVQCDFSDRGERILNATVAAILKSQSLALQSTDNIVGMLTAPGAMRKRVADDALPLHLSGAEEAVADQVTLAAIEKRRHDRLVDFEARRAAMQREAEQLGL